MQCHICFQKAIAPQRLAPLAAHRPQPPSRPPRTPTRAQSKTVSCPGDGTVVRSKDNTYVKHVVKLRTNKAYRAELGTVLLVGTTLIEEVLAACPREAPLNIKVLFCLEDEPLPDVYAQCVLRVSEPVFAKITGLVSVDGVGAAAEVDLPHDAQLNSMPRGTLQRLLVLDGIQDPGNLGTLLRTALALGWQAVYLLPGCCDPFNDKAVRASRGASFRIPLTHGDWEGLQALVDRHEMVAVAAQPRADVAKRGRALDECHAEDKILGTAGITRPPALGPQDMGPNWHCWDPLVAELEAGLTSASVCLVLGAEGQGVSEETLARCKAVGIPMQGDMESLNVGAAGAILMFVFSHSMPRLLSTLL